MATVTRSAADSAVKLFATLNVTADAISSAIVAAGSSFNVLESKANEWSRLTRKEIAGTQVSSEARIAADCARTIVEHQLEVQKFLGNDQGRKDAYAAAIQAVTEAMAAA